VLAHAVDAVHGAIHFDELMFELLMHERFYLWDDERLPVFGAEDKVYPVFALAVCHFVGLWKPLKRLGSGVLRLCPTTEAVG